MGEFRGGSRQRKLYFSVMSPFGLGVSWHDYNCYALWLQAYNFSQTMKISLFAYFFLNLFHWKSILFCFKKNVGVRTAVLCWEFSLVSPSSYMHPVHGSWLCQTEISNTTKVHSRYCAGRHPKLLGVYSIHSCAGLVFPSSSAAFQNHMFLSG